MLIGVRRALAILPATLLTTLVVTASAGAVTLGTTSLPTGAQLSPSCTVSSDSPTVEELVQTGTDASYDYTVPAAGVITSWSFNTTGATAGTPYGLVVVRSSDAGYTVVGSDTEMVPPSAPVVQTYTLATPIEVQAGDLIGAVVSTSTTVGCSFGGEALIADTITVDEGTPTPGTLLSSPDDNTSPGYLVNMSVNLDPPEDAGLTQQALPASITAGGEGVFMLNVTSAGAINGPVTVTDTVPSGLTIVGVSAGADKCSVSGQSISCSVPSAPASIAVVVSAATAGAYANSASVAIAGGLNDPNPADNSASVTLTVTPASTASAVLTTSCHLVSLAKVPLQEAKAVIRALGCQVGKVKAKHSKKIAKGEVISISPGGGRTVAAGTKVAIVYSSGPPKKKHKRKSHHRK